MLRFPSFLDFFFKVNFKNILIHNHFQQIRKSYCILLSKVRSLKLLLEILIIIIVLKFKFEYRGGRLY